jgi:hypothetical protein
MKLSLVSLLALSLAFPMSTIACGGEAGTDTSIDDGAGSDEAEVASYDIKKSEKLLAEAVALAEARKRHQVCEADAYQTTILDKLTEAVKVRNTIWFRTKVIAKKAVLVEQMGQNLAFKEIILGFTNTNGKLAGVEAALASGTLFFGPAPGAYGNMSKLEFKAGGKLTSSTLEISNDGNATWKSKEGRWSVDAKDNSRVIIDGKAFKLQKDGADYVLFDSPKYVPYEAFRSSPSECEA